MRIRRDEIKVGVLRVGGTNCDSETQRAFSEIGVYAEVLHLNRFAKGGSILDYHLLVLPGGFSFGDYVRAGAIWAKLIIARLGPDLKIFLDENRPILGICNGFQVLVEMGLLPAFEGISPYPEASLATNIPAGYNCRWIYLKQENRGKCMFTSQIRYGTVLHVPVAHSEGRFLLSTEKEECSLERLYGTDQMVFRYCTREGEYAEGRYPANPNGSFHDIAGICNNEGNIFGLMPHPERAFYPWQQPEWTNSDSTNRLSAAKTDGRLIFESVVNHIEKKSW